MDETVAWLRDRPYYEGQLRVHEVESGGGARFEALDLDPRLESALEARGIDRLYTHQTRAIEAVRGGEDVVVATPTASGKSLAYTVPAFERALDDRATALYLAPQVALVDDQTETLSALAGELGFGSGVEVAQYTGRQSRSEKAAIRDRQPTVLCCTPDMLHYGLLPHARRLWSWFFERLETVVVDEVHEYRGVFGSHVALVFRRLARLCGEFGADPEFVCCSATIGNPVEHAATVTGRDPDGVRLVDGDDSESGPTHWLLWNPPEYDGDGWGEGAGGGRRRSSHTETERLFCDLLARGYQTLVFTSSRQTAERYASESAGRLRERGEHDLAGAVEAYQAALTDERRREIEAGLKAGEVRGVWSTNALELGVDIGGLDAVVLDGYPGTRMAARQQAGRAGRGTDPSLVAVVAGEDQLDQYVVRNPDAFFEGDPERAVTNPENERLLPGHVRAAADESWLCPDDDRHFGDRFPSVVAELTEAGALSRRETDDGVRWLHDGADPHGNVSLRDIGDRQVRLRGPDGELVAELPFDDALRDAHPGAIYHHQGRSYEVTDLDLRAGVAQLQTTWADYFTRVLHEKAIMVAERLDSKALSTRPDVRITFADVEMRKQITGFQRFDASSGESLGTEALDLPETSLETRGLFFALPDDATAALEAGGDLPGGIHAAEHALISMFPATVLCDRRDVGGLSTPLHPETGAPTIFVYDGYPGGVALARTGYERFASLAGTTLEMLRGCPCEDGCPACVQSPHCGNANDPLDKRLATDLLATLLDR
ncbi:DEAD/DEAH box helicase [Natronomonas marina]|uniref:DEAD/DEAH box helicase n=1 Tax=Natronomonas marina TaxID=2961939 RepID=UPI0020C95EC5|nr:DEAD/DEAH box helicase [Natronomonas marina]